MRFSKSRDSKKKENQEPQRQQDAISKSPPRLPVLYNGAPGPQIQDGGETRPESLAIVSGTTSHRPDYEIDYNSHPMPRPPMDPAHGLTSVPPPPIPKGAHDPFARTESMTNRGRYSYASSAISTINSPRRVRRRKDPTPFNVLVVGTRNCGKTSLIEFLKSAFALPPKKRFKSTAEGEAHAVARIPPSGNFLPHYLETEIDNERIGLTLWDSEGLEKNVVDLQLREMSAFLESKFEETFTEEMKVVRSPGVQDTHVHAVFLVLDPARLDRNIAAARAATANGHQNGGKKFYHTRILGSLDEDLDLQVIRTLQGKTTVIPIISKADTVTTEHMAMLKKSVWDSLKKANLDLLEPLGFDEEDDSASDPAKIVEENEPEDEMEEFETPTDGDDVSVQHADPSLQSKGGSTRRQRGTDNTKEDELPYIPLSTISPDIYEPDVVGRKFPWGFADPYNEQHCDFVRLKDYVFSEWRTDLREVSREQWYEGWRTSRLNRREGTKTFCR